MIPLRQASNSFALHLFSHEIIQLHKRFIIQI
jgi:hypothetical protein